MMEKDESRQTGGKQKITTVVDVYEKKKKERNIIRMMMIIIWSCANDHRPSTISSRARLEKRLLVLTNNNQVYKKALYF